MNSEKSTFSTLFILLVAVLVFLPFITTFQDVLTRIILHFDAYRALQNVVVPYEMRVLAALLNILHLSTEAGPTYIQFIRNGKLEVIYLAWNCIGWQSFLLFSITLISGLSGAYTKMSKFQALLVGILGTYLINMLRLVLVIIVYYFTGRGIGVVFHDYFSNLLSILWLFIYWWIAYKFILEEFNPLTTKTQVKRGPVYWVKTFIKSKDKKQELVKVYQDILKSLRVFLKQIRVFVVSTDWRGLFLQIYEIAKILIKVIIKLSKITFVEIQRQTDRLFERYRR